MKYSNFVKVALIGQVSAGKTTSATSFSTNTGNTGLKRTTITPKISIFRDDVTEPVELTKKEKDEILADLGIKSDGFNPNDINVVYNVLRIPNLIMIDLPGFDDSDNNSGFMKMALDLIPKIDYIVCVSTITSFSSNSFLTHLNEFKKVADELKFNGHFVDFIHLINKIDDVDSLQADECVEDIVEKYGKTYNLKLGTNIFRYSASLHMMYCYNLLSAYDIPIVITSSTGLDEMKNHLKLAAANNTFAYKKVNTILSKLIKDKKAKIKNKWVDVKLSTKDFAGEMLNVDENTSKGDHDGFVPKLAILYDSLPKLKYEFELEYVKRKSGEIITGVNSGEVKIDELQSFLGNIKDSKIKSDGKILNLLKYTMSSITDSNIFISICSLFKNLSFKDNKNDNIFNIFYPSSSLKGTIHDDIIKLLSSDFKDHKYFISVLAKPEFWLNTMTINGGDKLCLDYVVDHLSSINDYNSKFCLEIIRMGQRSIMEIYVMTIDEPKYIEKICGVLGLKVSKLKAAINYYNYFSDKINKLYYGDDSSYYEYRYYDQTKWLLFNINKIGFMDKSSKANIHALNIKADKECKDTPVKVEKKPAKKSNI